MTKKIPPALKGLITGLVLVVVSLLLYYTNQKPSTGFQYLSYVIYAGGIFWTLFAYARSAEYTGKFGDIFNQGFRCFIVITLVSVMYTGIFTKMHPEFEEEYGVAIREHLQKTEKNKTPAEIDEMAKNSKSQYTTGMVFTSIFANLIIGAVFTAAGAGLLLTRRR